MHRLDVHTAPIPSARVEDEPSRNPGLSEAFVRLDAIAARILSGPLSAIVAGLCVLMAATWLPGYVLWPWWCDHDHFATVARAWDAGLLPYRDLVGNNFPGQMYAFLVVGKVFGWGRTTPFWLLDAGLLGLLAFSLLTWSRREFERLLPGFVALAALLGYYLNLDYSQVAQRDWQAPLLGWAGLLLLRSCPGRVMGRLAAVVSLSAAVTIRPQIGLMLPAFLAVVLLERERSPKARLGSAVLWGCVLASSIFIWFWPLFRLGLGPDLFEGIRGAVDGDSYNKAGTARILWELALQFLNVRFTGLLVLLAGIEVVGSRHRDLARIALVALLGMALYRPLSPLHHAYLLHPLAMSLSILLVIPTGLILEKSETPASWRLGGILLLLAIALPSWPRYADPRHVRDAWLFAQGREPNRGPTGYARNPDVLAAAAYPWDDYRRVLDYLRDLPPDTCVANALSGHSAINGPLGRLPAIPGESILWLSLIRASDETRFAERLRETPDSVVVWDPGRSLEDAPARFPTLRTAIISLYEPAVRFGSIEVWSRKPGSAWMDQAMNPSM